MRPFGLALFFALLLAPVTFGCGDDGGGGGGNLDLDAGVDASDDTDGVDTQPEPDLPAPELCSVEFPEGTCSGGQICIDGACVALDYVCSPSQLDGVCEFGGLCINGVCWGPDQVCGPQADIGVCPTGQFCNQGVCTTMGQCGPGEPAGQCPSGEVCHGETCRTASDFCSVGSPTGECPEGAVCLEGGCVSEAYLCGPEARAGRCAAGEACAGGECVDIAEACSLANPSGTCGGDLICLEGACRDASELCSPQNLFGFCADGLSCVDGSCQEQTQTCSPMVFDGVCPGEMTCAAGRCYGTVSCDNTFPFGGCSGDATCLCPRPNSASCSTDYAPASANAAQKTAVERTNELRNSIGLWSISEAAPINDATQAHADYLANAFADAHDENHPESEYFTGAAFWDRMDAAGYAGQPMGEVISFIDDPVRAVDGLVATVYHRMPFFSPYALELGYGGATGPLGSADVINFGGTSAPCQGSVLVVFPPDGAVDVPISWDGLESPTPPAPPQGYPSGPILSVHGSDDLVIDEHKILLGNAEVPHTHLTSDNDPNAHIDPTHYFLYPDAPLRSHTTYKVLVTGQHGGQPFHLRWSFTTGQ